MRIQWHTRLGKLYFYQFYRNSAILRIRVPISTKLPRQLEYKNVHKWNVRVEKWQIFSSQCWVTIQ